MKKEQIPVCPGCKKHCPMNSLCCGYGKKYFKKNPPETIGPEETEKRKWEKGLTRGSIIWKFVGTGRRIRKALRDGEIREAQLEAALNDEEKQQLGVIIEKLANISKINDK